MTSNTVTGNPNRDLLILNALADSLASDKHVTTDVLATEYLSKYPDFDLLDSELEGVQARLKEQHEGNAIAYASELIALLSRQDTEAPADAQPEESVPVEAVVASDGPKTLDEATELLADANEKLAQARGQVLVCQNREHTTRSQLADAIQEFQSGLVKLTPTELLRDNARQQHEMRRAVAEGRADASTRVSRPGPSAIDRQAFYGRGGSANTGYGRKYANRAKYTIEKARAIASQR